MGDVEQGQQEQDVETQTQEGAEPQEQEQEKPEQEVAPEGDGAEAKADDAEEPKEGEESKPDEGQAEEKRRRAGGWQRKLEKKERELEYWREQAMARQGQPPPGQQPPGQAVPEQTPEQKAAAYVQSMVAEGIRQEKERERQAAQQAEFAKRTQETIAAHPDFEDVVSSVEHIPVSPALQQVILTSPVGPEIMYQLAKSPGELARISALHPLDAAREIGRLEAKASSTPAPKTQTKSATRPPAPPTNVGGSSTSARDRDDLPIADYKRAFRSKR